MGLRRREDTRRPGLSVSSLAHCHLEREPDLVRGSPRPLSAGPPGDRVSGGQGGLPRVTSLHPGRQLAHVQHSSNVRDDGREGADPARKQTWAQKREHVECARRPRRSLPPSENDYGMVRSTAAQLAGGCRQMRVTTRPRSDGNLRGADCRGRSRVPALCGRAACRRLELRLRFPPPRRGAPGLEGPGSPGTDGVLAPTRPTPTIQNIMSALEKTSLDPGCPPCHLRHSLCRAGPRIRILKVVWPPWI